MFHSSRKHIACILFVALLTIFFASLYYAMVTGLERHALSRMQVVSRFSALLVWDKLRAYSESVDLLTGLLPRFPDNREVLSEISNLGKDDFHAHTVVLNEKREFLYFDEHAGKVVRPGEEFSSVWREALLRASSSTTGITGPLPSLTHDNDNEMLFARSYHTAQSSGVFGLAIRVESFENSLHALGVLTRGGRNFYLVDANDRIIASSDRDKGTRYFREVPLLAALSDSILRGGSSLLEFENRDFFVCADKVAKTGWTLYLFSPADLELSMVPLLSWILAAGWLILCVCVLLLLYFSGQREKYKVLSEVDHLTGADNRFAFDQALQSCKQDGPYPVCLLVMDVDGLKIINDALGHEAGDALLRRVMLLLQRSLRDGDTVYRLGGDEFAVLLPDVDYATAQNLSERITVQAAMMRERTGLPPVFLSLGFAEANDQHACTNLFNRADEAMYSNKKVRKDAAHRAILRWIKKHPELVDRRKHQTPAR